MSATPDKFAAIYVRVSTRKQSHRSQLPDLKRWAAAHDGPVRWYRDTGSGKTTDRPGWQKLEADIAAGKVSAVVCWRIDRLGRAVSALSALFDELQRRRVNLVSIKDGLDLSTPAGRLLANVLASVAQFETELRGERVQAGQAAARAAGKTWGGSEKGVRRKLTPAVARTVHRLKADGESVTAIAKTVGVSRQSVYTVLADMAPTA
ncbi:recombinase family protein [Alienimonas chondri]|uniref:DNA-invertase hin n=1 Tax=Alienimonas chondri TaxID=2681879 RepID=A0ABX1VEJ0_9PLAN|nr:recombinase family protein [Alienimonas chondri]NNJ26149.1 DNA-invertase hin [Alienimonas chondri]